MNPTLQELIRWCHRNPRRVHPSCRQYFVTNTLNLYFLVHPFTSFENLNPLAQEIALTMHD